MKKILLSVLFLVIAVPFPAVAESIVETTTKKLLPPSDKKIFTTTKEERQERLETLRKEKKQFQETEKSFIADNNLAVTRLKTQINQTETALAKDPDNEYLKKKLELSVDLFNYKNAERQLREQIQGIIDEHIKLLKEYVADPELKAFERGLIEKKKAYSFDKELLDMYELTLNKERELAQLIEQEANANAELENRKRAIGAANDEVKKKEGSKAGEPYIRDLGLTGAQRSELASLQEKVSAARKQIDQMRIQEIEYKINLVKTRIVMVRQQLDITRELFKTIKPLTTVNEAEIANAQEEIDKKRQQSFLVKTDLRSQIEKLGAQIRDKENELERMSKRYGIPTGQDLDEWRIEPRRTIAGYNAFMQIALLNDSLLLLKRKRETLESKLALEDAKLHSETLNLSVKESFFKVINRKFTNQDEVSNEIKRFDASKADDQANLALIKERLNTFMALSATQKKALENIRTRKQAVENERSGLFKSHGSDYNAIIAGLTEAEAQVQSQIDQIAKITSTYSDAATILNQALKNIEFIVSELGVITIWYRPEHAISWRGIQNSVTDLQVFFKDVYANFSFKNIGMLLNKTRSLFKFSVATLTFWIKLLGALALLVLTRKNAPLVVQKLLSATRAPMLLRTLLGYAAVIIEFISRHVIGIGVWLFFYLWLLMAPGTYDPYLSVLFYLLSIPYLLYLSHRWLRYLVAFNERHDYLLISKDYQPRFIFVLSVLVYATIVIFFFREAFIVGNYRKSEVPTILLALYFIIVQISAIMLIVKEQLLSLIPTYSAFWHWVYETVDSFYYLILVVLVAIIVMSNPYVGFGRLVLYILNKLIYTLIVFQILSWIHDWLKRATSKIFFYEDEEVLKERFAAGKTWYGFTVLGIFLVMTFVGIVLIARIWSWPEAVVRISTWHDIAGLIRAPILLGDTSSPISLYTVFKLFSFVLAGMFASFVIQKFILRRIFDILLIEPGVQNTVSSLTRYLVLITAVIIGFQSVGLGELVWYLIGALILGIGWVIKDPISDFIAYFIILVQRPVKVGDYIWMDNDTMGLVRKVTPRSVIVRRKNSTTLVIPNSQVMNKIVVNWNYTSGFIAFDDILLTIAYDDDAEMVRELLHKVLSESSYVLKNPRPIVRLESFTEFGYQFLIRGFLSSNHTLDQWDIASDIRFAIVKRLREHKIHLAYPVRLLKTSKTNRPELVISDREHIPGQE
ncbi:hypothetical protein Noda2021_01100 [Candidatus Dependentiae bacterium Noda2021]|nr:hypothetical protein Noda2021_01100 [Candidatus Dependentiae bacterium Noda2021]